MINFKEYLQTEQLTDEEIDSIIESIDWEDIVEFYETEELTLDEAITSSERIRMAQKMRSRKQMLALARKTKLKRPSSTDVIMRRSKTAARKLMYKKLLKGRSKGQLSASEKNQIEARVAMLMSMAKNLPQKLAPKVKELERKRLRRANKQ